MNKFLFFLIALQAPVLLAIDENPIGKKRVREEDLIDFETPLAKKKAVFPLHQACLNGNLPEVKEVFSSGLLNVQELNSEGLSPMQCLEASYKEFIDTDMNLLFTNPDSRNLENEKKFIRIAAALILKGADLPKDNFLLDGLKEYFSAMLAGYIRKLKDRSWEPGMSAGFELIIKTGLIDLTETAQRILDIWPIDGRRFASDINFPLALSVLYHHGGFHPDYVKSQFYLDRIYNYKQLLRASLANNDRNGSERVMTAVKELKGYVKPLRYKNLLHNLLKILSESRNLNAITYVEKLIELGLDINNPDPDESTSALLVSLMDKNFAIASLLLKRGANIDRKISEKIVSIHNIGIICESSLIHVFVSTRLTEVVEFLIENGAEIAAVDNKGNTPLHTLCQTSDAPNYPDNVKEQDLKIMAFLLKKGANPNIKNKNGYTPIMLAPSVEMARLLLSKGAIIEKATINIPSVIRAGRTNNLELLEFWRDQGADLASQTTQAKGRTLFLDLCFFFSSEKTIAIELLEYLFGLGADINAFDVDNENALMYACRHSKEELVKWLIEHDANLDHRRFNRGKSETALSIACSTGPDYTIIDLLLAGGCTVPNDFNNAYIRIKLEQKSALYEAVVSGDLQTVQQLIAEGGNLWIDVKTHTGDFLIDISNRLDNKNIYNFLISKSKKKSPTKTTKSARKI